MSGTVRKSVVSSASLPATTGYPEGYILISGGSIYKNVSGTWTVFGGGGGATGATGPVGATGASSTGATGPVGATGAGGGGGGGSTYERLASNITFDSTDGSTSLFTDFTVAVGEVYEVEAFFRYSADDVTARVYFTVEYVSGGFASFDLAEGELWYDTTTGYQKLPTNLIGNGNLVGGTDNDLVGTGIPLIGKLRVIAENNDVSPSVNNFKGVTLVAGPTVTFLSGAVLKITQVV